MTGQPKAEPPKRPPDTETGDTAFDRMRDLTRRVAAVPKADAVKPKTMKRKTR